jgi:putative addiction module CopG family antidote
MSKPTDLPDDVLSFATAQVSAGRYPDVPAVLRAGVQALERAEQRRARKLEALCAALIEGEESGEAPPGSFERAKARVRELAAARRSA